MAGCLTFLLSSKVARCPPQQLDSTIAVREWALFNAHLILFLCMCVYNTVLHWSCSQSKWASGHENQRSRPFLLLSGASCSPGSGGQINSKPKAGEQVVNKHWLPIFCYSFRHFMGPILCGKLPILLWMSGLTRQWRTCSELKLNQHSESQSVVVFFNSSMNDFLTSMHAHTEKMPRAIHEYMAPLPPPPPIHIKEFY